MDITLSPSANGTLHPKNMAMRRDGIAGIPFDNTAYQILADPTYQDADSNLIWSVADKDDGEALMMRFPAINKPELFSTTIAPTITVFYRMRRGSIVEIGDPDDPIVASAVFPLIYHPDYGTKTAISSTELTTSWVTYSATITPTWPWVGHAIDLGEVQAGILWRPDDPGTSRPYITSMRLRVSTPIDSADITWYSISPDGATWNPTTGVAAGWIPISDPTGNWSTQ